MAVNNLKIISLFSGCGGLDLGFKNAGYNIIWANEYNKKIIPTYKKNNPETILDERSITEVPSSEIPETDGIIGGPPCQSWSLAGSMKGIEDNRGKLFYEYARVLRDKKPKFFLAENVPGLISKAHIKEFNKMIEMFDNLGYKVKFKKLNAVNYGVPQTRKRVFIIGFRKDLDIDYKFPKKTHSKKVKENKTLKNKNFQRNIKPIKTLKEAIGDLPEPKAAKEKNYTNGDELEINAHEYYIGGFSSRFMSRNRRRGWDEPAYTVQANGRHARIHPSAKPMVKIEKDNWKFGGDTTPRRLSVRESARIQTFPDSYKFYYEKVNTGYKMVGNAVPVKLSEILAKSILAYCRSENDEKVKVKKA